MKALSLGVFSLSLVLMGCGGHRKTAHPAPTYERWTLPEWAPPEQEDMTVDFSEMEGEWVTESNGEENPGADQHPEQGADPDPESEEASSEGVEAPRSGPESGHDGGSADNPAPTGDP